MYAIHLLEETGSQPDITWLVWVVLAVFLAMVFLGWLVARKGWLKDENEPEHKEQGSHHT
jgi:cytoskeletal protein RodZ